MNLLLRVALFMHIFFDITNNCYVYARRNLVERGNAMGHLSNIFSIYIDIVMLCIGLYMTFIEATNLIEVTKFEREGNVVRVLGWLYIIIAIIGFIILILN